MNWIAAFRRAWAAWLFLLVSLVASGMAQAIKPTITSANSATFTVGQSNSLPNPACR